MQSEINEIRAALEVIEAASGTPAVTEEFLLDAVTFMRAKLKLIELQQAGYRLSPKDVVVVPVMSLARVAAAATRGHRARFRVIDGEKA